MTEQNDAVLLGANVRRKQKSYVHRLAKIRGASMSLVVRDMIEFYREQHPKADRPAPLSLRAQAIRRKLPERAAQPVPSQGV